MGVYEHKQGKYESYRVARTIDGVLHQKYFPKTKQGLADAKACDHEQVLKQFEAQKHFTGYRGRWKRTA